MSKFKEIWEKHLKEPAKELLFGVLAKLFKNLISKFTSGLNKVEKTQEVKVVHVPVTKPKKITWVDGVENYNSRGTADITAIILHHTGPGGLQATLSWAKNNDSNISYHYVIDRNGDVYQLVKEKHRAWHAGVSKLHGRGDVNTFSVGVAFVSDGTDGYTDKQYESGAWITKMLKTKYNINNAYIKGHKDVAPERKHDPAKFDWDRFFNLVNKETL